MPEQEPWLLELILFFKKLLSFKATECQTSLGLPRESLAFVAGVLLLPSIIQIKEEAKNKPKAKP